MSVILLSACSATAFSALLYWAYRRQSIKNLPFWCRVKWTFLTPSLWLVKSLRRLVRRRDGPAAEIERQIGGSPTFFASDRHGNVAMLRLRRHYLITSSNSERKFAEVQLLLRLKDGRAFSHILTPDCLTPDETPFGDEADENYMSAGGLRIQIINPCMTYRLIYCGLMSRIDEVTPHLDHVNLRLWFRSLSDPVDYAIDYSAALFATSLAQESHSITALTLFLDSPEVHVEQSGELRGFVEISEEPRLELTLNGLRDSATVFAEYKLGTVFFGLKVRFENGLVISLAARTPHQVEGFVTYPTGYVYPVTRSDLLSSSFFTENRSPPQKFAFTLSAHSRTFTLSIEIIETTVSKLVMDNSLSNCKMQQNVVKVQLSSEQTHRIETGYGIVEFGNLNEPSSGDDGLVENLPILTNVIKPPYKPGVVPFCLQLNDPLCRLSSITGGKAAKLADILMAISLSKGDEIQPEVSVPEGFAVTVSAYENHLNANPHLAELIKQTLALANSTSELESACAKLKDAFLATSLSDNLVREIEMALLECFNDEEVFLAVRSSAVGEDGSEASGAGQMETFLGIRGTTQVIDSIKQCWASHYSYRAIGYRRQLCAKLDSSMAVLVQRLVKADVAGVLFTRHPDNGSTSKMVINASYGIGESVVSGSVQPDTITVEHERGNNLKIVYNVLGEKATAFKLDENEMTVTLEQIDSTSSSTSCCMAEDEIGHLVRVGLFIERIFGCGRDVEFALVKNSSSVSILQARPITTADMETEWELLHEFDSPLAGDRECLTTANLQEMMPGALTPLSGRVWLDMIGAALEMTHSVIFMKPKRRFPLQRITTMNYQHLFMNYTSLGAGMTNEENKLNSDMALFGRRIDELSVQHFLEQNDMTRGWQSFMGVLQYIRIRFPQTGMPGLAGKIENFQTPSADEPAVLFEEIQQKLMPFVRNVWFEHTLNNFTASIYPNILRHTLDPSMQWGPQIHADMAKMLSTSCEDVISADVPTQLQNLANSIRQDPEGKEAFAKMDRSETAKWLLSSPQHGEMFKTFLAKHGHRCVRDSDIRERPWNEEPEKLVDALKVMVETDVLPCEEMRKREILSIDEAINAIQTPINHHQRAKLRWILPKARRYVAIREWSKSLGIKMTDHCRRSYKRLATLLVENDYLPDEDLIYFLDVHEIGSLLRRKSPKLIAKALRRRKLFGSFQNLKFEELIFGHSEPSQNLPLVFSGQFPAEGVLIIKGTAVGDGCGSGNARVVRSLSEANQIQSGDVLIVPFTDVGWTPYFPMLSGLVTELGGIISHGAVIAREYGLPCLVGCKSATELIKTGDKVLIDGLNGQITVLTVENC